MQENKLTILKRGCNFIIALDLDTFGLKMSFFTQIERVLLRKYACIMHILNISACCSLQIDAQCLELENARKRDN